MRTGFSFVQVGNRVAVTKRRPKRLRSGGLVCGTALAVFFGLGQPVEAQADGCWPVTSGSRVSLMSDAADPDVFLWDSRQRLIDYAAGQWGDARAIFAHTVLARPGTSAVVVSCESGVAHPRYQSGTQDAIGVRIMSGPYRGRSGWVLSSDVHPLRGSSRDSSVVGTPRN
jgi:hypothetical protein